MSLGLHFKMPFIETVKKIDARIQTLDEAPDRFVTSEKKDLMVDSYAKWRIVDFSTYYLRTSGSIDNARALLKQKINNGLRTEFGSRTIKEIVSGDRDDIMEQSLASAKSESLKILVSKSSMFVLKQLTYRRKSVTQFTIV